MNPPSNPNSLIGCWLGDNNRYRLDNLLGRGGMGEVFLAMDTRIGKQVALKLLKDTLIESNEARRRFEREIQVCAALKSDNIVEVSDCGVTGEGYLFYVMEYLQGETLRQLLQREERLSAKQTAGIITQICKGLQFAHTGVHLWRDNQVVHVVHRDLKPDNIFLVPTDSGELVKILDFGIAKIRNPYFEETNFTGTLFLGTFRYASPEQLRGENDLDGRSDIYSLGIIFYEMLSGVDPFGFSINARSPSEASWIFAHTNELPKPLRQQQDCEDLSPQIEAVVMKCLEKKPSDRFASVEELNLALQAAVKTIPTEDLITPIRPLAIAANTFVQIRVSKSRKKILSLGAIAILSLVVVLSVSVGIPPKYHQSELSSELSPVPESSPQLSPVPESSSQVSPVPKSSPQLSPVPESSSQVSPVPESSSQLSPVPESSSQVSPVPESSSQVSPVPESSSQVSPVPESQLSFQPEPKSPPKPKSPPQSQPETKFLPQPQILDELRSLKSAGKYQNCINQSKTVSQSSGFYQNAQEIMNECQLEYAQKLDSEKKIVEAINQLKQIQQRNPKNSRFYQQAQKYLDELEKI